MVLAHAREWLKSLDKAYWLGFTLALLTYIALGAAGERFSPFAALDLAAGFALALVLAHGARHWPVVFLGSVLLGLWQHGGWTLSLGVASFNTAAALLAAVLLVRYADFRMELARLRDALVFPFVVVVLQALTAAGQMGLVAAAGGAQPPAELGWQGLWLARWLGSIAGVMVVAPFFLAFREPLGPRPRAWYVETLATAVTAMLVSGAVFAPISPLGGVRYPLAFVPLIVVILAAVRFELRGAVVATVLCVVVSLTGTRSGGGPFASPVTFDRFTLSAVFDAVVAFSGLLVASAVAELRRERSLRSGLELTRQIVEALPVGVWVLGRDGATLQANAAARELVPSIQFSPEAASGVVGWLGRERRPMRAGEWPVLSTARAGTACQDVELVLDSSGGEAHTVSLSAVPLRDEERRLVGAVGVLYDMSERLRAEQHLLELAAVVEQTADIVLVTDPEGVIEYANPAFESATGYRSDEVTGENPSIVRSGAHPPEFYQELWRTIKAGQPFRGVFQNRRKNGEILFEEKTITSLRDARGAISHFVSTGKDVTERVRAEEQLQRVLRARRLLGEGNRTMVHATTEEELLERMCRVLVEEGGYRMAWVVMAQADEARSVRVAASWGVEPQDVASVSLGWGEDSAGQGPTGTAIRTGNTAVARNLGGDPRYVHWYGIIAKYGLRTAISLPLKSVSRSFGAVTLYAAEDTAPDPEEVEILEELAADIAYSYESLRTKKLHEQAEKMLEHMVRGTASETGAEFLRSLVENLAKALGTRYAFVGELVGPDLKRMRPVAFWADGALTPGMERDIAGTPCEEVAERSECYYPHKATALFPNDSLLSCYGVESFLGQRLFGSGGKPVGVLAVMDTKPMDQSAQARAVLTIFAARAGAELKRLEAEHAAASAHELLREAVASIAEGFVLYGPDDRLALCNQAYRDIYTESADLLVPGNTFEAIIRKGAERGQYKGAIGNVDAWVAERMRRHRAADGTAIEQEVAEGRWVMILEQRTPSGYIAGSRIDITALKNTERALRESESRFRMLTDLSSDYITELDENYRYTPVGLESADKFALRQPGFLGKTPWEIPDSNLTEAQRAELCAVHERRETFRDFEYSRMSADGKIRWISASGAPFFDENGRFKGYRGVGRDITERKNAEFELRRFRLAMDTSVDSIYLTDPGAMRFVDVNEEACRRLGYSREQLLQRRPEDVLDIDRGELRRTYDEVIAAGEKGTMKEVVYVTSTGERGWSELYRRAMRSDGGWLIVTVGRDITARKRAELALEESEQILREITGNVPDYFLVTDAANGSILYANEGWARLTRAPHFSLKHYSVILEMVHPDDEARMRTAIAKQPLGGLDEECRVLDAERAVHWLHVRTSPILDHAGRVYRVATVARDITESKAAEERLDRLAHYDTLTGLPNRFHFHSSFSRLLEQAREQGWKVGLLFVDLDRFKAVNDTLGDAASDELLRLAAARLLDCVRVRDLVARLGGDEFALALPAIESAEQAGAIAEKIVAAFGRPFEVLGRELFVTASIGITVYPEDATEAAELLRFADAAMYRAKEEGRNTYRFYKSEMNQRAAERLELENALRYASARSEFVLHYQPKLDLQSGAIVGVEALLRWRRRAAEMVSPADFVPLLEETGLIVPVGEWVIHEACRQIRAWRDQGLGSVRVAVNLSSRQFLEPEARLVAPLDRCLREHGLEAGLIDFEITESALMAHTEKTLDILARLKELGARIAVDDFGTGYSSLAYLRRFPIDAVKIDRAFVRALPGNAGDAAVVRAVIDMAHALGMRAVAEGVETDEQTQFLRREGCDEIQGYLFSRPAAASDIAELLRRHDPRSFRG
ncbi:MAG: EAL domain-containing protein [Betaproteobacteria bacterium]|nr:EAL domain-containing protein [Betaproteobacteria bacterium]